MQRSIFVLLASVCLFGCSENGDLMYISSTPASQYDKDDEDNPESKPQDPAQSNPPVNPSDPTTPGDSTDPVDPEQPGDCTQTDCSGVSVCLQNDKNNCGACGNVCDGADTFCLGGQCQNVCGGLVCNGVCIDPQIDNGNCGECGKVCGAQEKCVAGSCVSTCDGTVCGADCVNDFTSNHDHCGACDHACGADQVCSNGSCACSEAGATICGDVCISDFSSNHDNCGSCGHACGNDQVCNNGTCECAASGMAICGDACVDILSSTVNCGGCGQVCETTCESGVCKPADPENDMFVVEIARQFLFEKTHKCTYDLRDEIPYFVDYYDQGASFNYGYDKNCASFVGSMFKEAGIFSPNEGRQMVSQYRDLCENSHAHGYYVVANEDARPGDIWYSKSHVEIVVETDLANSRHKLIGSNNYNSNDTIECLQNHNTNSKLSSDPTDYQRVTEQYRDFGKGTICSRYK